MSDQQFNAASGHGDDWGINNLSAAADEGRLVEPYPKIWVKTPNVTLYEPEVDNSWIMAGDEGNV